MTERTTQGTTRIEELLAGRQQISEWLERLQEAGSKVPPAVRDRVRADYESRLGAVVGELRGHSAAITDSLAGLRTELAAREREQSVEQEALAEAELRYSVGEYGEAEWRVHEERSGIRLEALGAELHRLGSEIVRLEEVLAQIAGAPAPAATMEAQDDPGAVDLEQAPPGAGEAAEAFRLEANSFITIEDAPADPRTQSVFDAGSAFPTAPDPAFEAVEPMAPLAPEAPRFTPRSGAIPPRPRISAAHKAVDDELAFLKSVTSEPARSAAPELKVASVPSAVGTKTLKCQDCGTLNRPTEWYCERCGAELSAV